MKQFKNLDEIVDYTIRRTAEKVLEELEKKKKTGAKNEIKK
jgi:hypothetical protein